MNAKQFKLSFLSLVLASSCAWAQWINPRSVTEIEIEDVDVNFWSLLQDGQVYLKQGHKTAVQIEAKGNRLVSEEVVKTSNDDIRIDEVAYYRASRVFQIEYLGSMSNKQLNDDLDLFLNQEVVSDPNACPKVYAKMFVLPSELMLAGQAKDSFPESLVFEPLSFKYDSQYGLIFKYSGFELPLQALILGINKSNVVFVEYYCKTRVS